jgi:lincosamide nucleotidyltransferase A/C/D/E
MDGRERPGAWTRLTSALNAVLWALPLPYRLTALLSLFVYRNPPVPESRVFETLAALERAGIDAVLAGGWAVDALLGRQLRTHRDIDLLIDAGDLPRARSALWPLGYAAWHSDPAPTAIGHLKITCAEALRDRAMRVAELHCTALDELETVAGSLDGGPVRCLVAEIQLEAQLVSSGRDWTPERRRRRRLNIEAIERAEKEQAQAEA